MTIENLGNVVGLIKSPNPPAKTYIIWARQLSPISNPNLVELNIHNGTTWVPLGSGGGSSVIVDQDLPLYIVNDFNGKPDYTVPIHDEIVVRHQGSYRRDFNEGITADIGDGQGARVLDVEVVSFSGVLGLGQIFGGNWDTNAPISYIRTVITDPNTSEVQSLSSSIEVTQENGQFQTVYFFLKNDVDGKIHRNIFSEFNVFTTSYEVYGGWIDNAGNYTDTSPTIGGGGVPEAPQDGSKYVRKDAAWVDTNNYFKYLVVDSAKTFSTNVTDINASFIISIGSYFNGIDATTTDYSSHFTLKSTSNVPITISVIKSGAENYLITVDKSSLYSVFALGGFNQIVLTADGSADGGVLLYDVLLVEVDTSPMELVKCYNIQEGRMWDESGLFILSYPKVTLAEINSSAYEVGSFTDLTIKPNTQDCVISTYVTRVSTPYLTVFPPINLQVSSPNNIFSKEMELRSQIDTGTGYQTIIKHFVVFFKVKEVN